VVILAGALDFGRCPLTSRLPMPLWPALDGSVLNRLLRTFDDRRIDNIVICSNGTGSLLRRSVQAPVYPKLTILNEPLPMGTAGCIRQAADTGSDGLIIALNANMILPPKIDTLLRLHDRQKSVLTVMLNPRTFTSHQQSQLADIYVCEPAVLDHIPHQSYFDIKEGLIPALVQFDKPVRVATLPKPAGNFHDRAGYLSAVAYYLNNHSNGRAANADIDPTARIHGPVAIMDSASIAKEVVILGPAVIGRNVKIANNCLVTDSVLWDGATIGPHSRLQGCIVDYNAVVPAHSNLRDTATTAKQTSARPNSITKTAIHPGLNKINRKFANLLKSEKTTKFLFPSLAYTAVLAALCWSYWPQLRSLLRIWLSSDEYSSGLLVPLLAIYIVWSRRHQIAKCTIKPSIAGLFGLLSAQLLRYFGLVFMYSSAERFSLVLSIASLVLLLFGWDIFRKLAGVMLFLLLMLPLPRSVHTAIILPLQNWATASAVFCLQAMGYEAIRHGNIVQINDTSVAIAEACNGLRMATAFLLISAVVVLLVKRPLWEKLTILASSLPIGFTCNTIRLTITAILFTFPGGSDYQWLFHDFFGLAMMPVALLAVVFELWLLSKLMPSG